MEKCEVLQIRLSKSQKDDIKKAAVVAGVTVTQLILSYLAGERVGDILLTSKRNKADL